VHNCVDEQQQYCCTQIGKQIEQKSGEQSSTAAAMTQRQRSAAEDVRWRRRPSRSANYSMELV